MRIPVVAIVSSYVSVHSPINHDPASLHHQLEYPSNLRLEHLGMWCLRINKVRQIREPKARVPTIPSLLICSSIFSKTKAKPSKTTTLTPMKTQTTTSHPRTSSNHHYTNSKEGLQTKQDPLSRARFSFNIRSNFQRINVCKVSEVHLTQGSKSSPLPCRAKLRSAQRGKACCLTVCCSKMTTFLHRLNLFRSNSHS